MVETEQDLLAKQKSSRDELGSVYTVNGVLEAQYQYYRNHLYALKATIHISRFSCVFLTSLGQMKPEGLVLLQS